MTEPHAIALQRADPTRIYMLSAAQKMPVQLALPQAGANMFCGENSGQWRFWHEGLHILGATNMHESG